MLLYAAKGPPGNRRRFQPRHFAMLARGLAPGAVRWARGLAELPQGGWALVVHAPGSYALNRELAQRHAGGLYALDVLSLDERRALEARDGVLLIDLDWDPLFPLEEVVAGLIASIGEMGLPPSRVRILHANQAARAPFEALWRAHSDEPPCRTLEFPTSFALGLVYQHARRSGGAISRRLGRAKASLAEGRKGKAFNLFNGGLRPHRLHLLASLHRAGLMERGHVSMLGYSKDPRGTRRHGAREAPPLPPDLRHESAKLPYPDGIDPSLQAVWRMLPLTLDLKHDFRWLGYERMVWSSQAARYYDDSAFSVVTEPYALRREVLHLTEKLMKPILNAHPFLCLGGGGALAQLRAYGFETFAPAFDERYDAEPEPRERMRLILDELMRLASMPDGDLREISLQLWPRCEHNLLHFWNGAVERLSDAFRAEVLDRIF